MRFKNLTAKAAAAAYKELAKVAQDAADKYDKVDKAYANAFVGENDSGFQDKPELNPAESALALQLAFQSAQKADEAATKAKTKFDADVKDFLKSQRCYGPDAHK